MKIALWFFILFLIASPAALASTVECYDDGSVRIEGMRKKFSVTAKEKSAASYFEVPGDYIYNQKEDHYDFYSDEGIFVGQKKTKYSLKYGKSSKTVTCPPFKFSCRILNISIDYCYTRENSYTGENIFTSKFMVYSFHFNKTSVLRFEQPFLLRYDVDLGDHRIFIHSPVILSPEFAEINMTVRKLHAGNKYTLQWDTNRTVERFMIRYDECRQRRYNFYTSAACTEAAACTINDDCFEDEQCAQRRCEKLACGECQYVQDHSCVDYACCSSEECTEDEQCIEHTCTKAACAEGEFIANHACFPLECASDEYVSNHTCVPLQCLETEYAVHHACQELQCSWWEKPKNHTCVNLLQDWWKSLLR